MRKNRRRMKKKVRLFVTMFLLIGLLFAGKTLANDLLATDSSKQVLKAYQKSAKKLNSGNPIIEATIANGMELVGKSPYVWGGGRTDESITKDEFDCSSFVAMMFYLGGQQIDLQSQTTTYTLVDVGLQSNWLAKERGDLLFDKELEHVVIYLGDDYILHDSPNSSTGGVGINRLSDVINKDKLGDMTWEEFLEDGYVRTQVVG